jgi:hypothetical protein
MNLEDSCTILQVFGEELARDLGMNVSGLHHYFTAVVANHRIGCVHDRPQVRPA